MNVLVACVGNVFLGDDGFGPEVARALARRQLPDGVRAADFGIRGLHLAYELLHPHDLVLIVDAVQRGDPPGTLTLIVPSLDGAAAAPAPDAHGMDLGAVFAQVQALGGTLPNLLVLGCEVESTDERMGLRPAVEAAVETAAEMVVEIVARERATWEAQRCGPTATW